jgi:hypothetical protein
LQGIKHVLCMGFKILLLGHWVCNLKGSKFVRHLICTLLGFQGMLVPKIQISMSLQYLFFI